MKWPACSGCVVESLRSSACSSSSVSDLIVIPAYLFLSSLRACAVGHASSFQVFAAVERFGMLMLTLGPMLNLTSYGIFRSAAHPSWIYNRGWLSSESLELLGIAVLDISLIDMEEIWVLIAEVTGFMLLCGAAGLHFEYSNEYDRVPSVSLRLDTTHASECFGLIVLTIVAVCQYRIKVHKHQQSVLHNHAHHRNIPRHSDLV